MVITILLSVIAILIFIFLKVRSLRSGNGGAGLSLDLSAPTIPSEIVGDIKEDVSLPTVSKPFDLDALIRKWVLIRGNLTFAEIKAIVMLESSGNPNAMNPNDPSWGLMQITPLIGRAYAGITQNEQLFDPDINMKAGTGFLSHLKSRYHSQFPNHEWVQAYNEGEGNFDRGKRVWNYYYTFMKWYQRYA